MLSSYQHAGCNSVCWGISVRFCASSVTEVNDRLVVTGSLVRSCGIPEGNFTRNAQEVYCLIWVLKLLIWNHTTSPRRQLVNTLKPRQNGCHFADDTFKRMFMNENASILIRILLKFVPKVWINNIPALVQIVAWRRPGDKPLSEPMMVSLPTHLCLTWPQWVNPDVGHLDGSSSVWCLVGLLLLFQSV